MIDTYFNDIDTYIPLYTLQIWILRVYIYILLNCNYYIRPVFNVIHVCSLKSVGITPT